MNFKKNLPTSCPGCGVDFVDDSVYSVWGIQICYGAAAVDDLRDDSINISGLTEGDNDVTPYKIDCGECGHILYENVDIIDVLNNIKS